MWRSPSIPRRPGPRGLLRNAFAEDQAPGYLLHDRDGAFAAVATTVAGMHIQSIRTAPRSPWQNAYVERVIGSIRRRVPGSRYRRERGRIAPSARGLRPVLHALAHAPRTRKG